MSIDAELAAAAASQEALDTWLAVLDPVDPSRPSLLPGWTVGHVLTHIARGADSHVEMLAGRPQYPDGPAGRDRDIEGGAGRPWHELVADVAASSARLAAAWAACSDWSAYGQGMFGPRPLAGLPANRRREVEIHRVDLGLGYGFADLPDDYVAADVVAAEREWSTRHDGAAPPADAPGEPRARLAWLLGR